MHTYAQTNLQLSAQLDEQGWPHPDQQLLADSYLLASELFAGQYRASGKTFLSHLVGVASILAHHGASPTVVSAGLLHAAYSNGDFRVRMSGRISKYRMEMSRVVGSDVESLVHRYTFFGWSTGDIGRYADSAAAPADLVFMRLANELEDCLDGGLLACADGSDRIDDFARAADQFTTLSQQIGRPALGQELNDTVLADLHRTPPAIGPTGRSGAYTLVPRSYRRRHPISFRLWISRRISTIRAYLRR